MSGKPSRHQSPTVQPPLEVWQQTRKIVSDYAKKVEDLALKCQANQAHKRVSFAKAIYDADRFELVVTSGKSGVGKSNLVCGILDEPDSLSVHPTTPYLYKILNQIEKSAPSLTELDDEPVDALVDLKKGYQTLTLEAKEDIISGEIVEETDESVTLKTGEETLTFSKATLQSQLTIVTLDEEKIVGSIKSETADEIVLNVDGDERTIDTLDIAEKYYLRGKRLPPPLPIKEYTVFFKPAKSEARPPEPTEIPEKDIGNYVPQGEVEFISIHLPNDLLKNNVVIVDAPSLDMLLFQQDIRILRHVLNAHAFLFVLDGLMNQEEKVHLTTLRNITDSIYFVQTKIDTFREEWQEWRRRNIQIIAEVLDVPPAELRYRYFPVSSRDKTDADTMRKAADKKAESALPEAVSELEAKSRFSRLQQFLKSISSKTDKERETLARHFLQQLRFEIETLRLQTDINQAELEKYQVWFDKTYQPLKVHFAEESETIYQKTKAELNRAFGSQGYRPIIMELIETLPDMSAGRLRGDIKAIQQRCIDECTQEVERILGTYIEQMDQLFNDVAEQLHHPLKRTGESTVSGLTIHLVEKLLPLPSRQGETLQSLMYPLMLGSGALRPATSPWEMGIQIGTGVIALVIWGIAQYHKSLDLEITHKTQRIAEIKNILEGIVRESAEQAAHQLQTFIQTYNKEALKLFQNFEEAANGVLLDNDASKTEALQSQKREVEMLARDIGKTLKQLKKD